jgi:2-octaprenylphenol hydroxylase
MRSHNFDVIIVGGGVVGLSFACALAQNTSLSIAVLDAKPASNHWSPDKYHHRVSAVSLASQRLFDSIKVWDAMRSMRVSPFTSIQVWDGVREGQIQFAARDIHEPLLGYIIENEVMQLALLQKLSAYSQVSYLAPVALSQLQNTGDRIEITLQDGTLVMGQLLVAADGMHSWVREQLAIPLKKLNYKQHAVVATVETALPHTMCARQVFLATGPLAFLPLINSHLSSVVWSLPTEQAEKMLELSDEAFKQALSNAFDHRLGDVVNVKDRFILPLSKQLAAQYTQNRVALVGDAAHVVHPLAGQGVNMGLLDAACLTDVIVNAINQKRNYAALHTLRRYERWRRADNTTMQIGIDAIKNIFASQRKPIQVARSLGLSCVDQFSWLKMKLTRHAVGNKTDLPTLSRSQGES